MDRLNIYWIFGLAWVITIITVWAAILFNNRESKVVRSITCPVCGKKATLIKYTKTNPPHSFYRCNSSECKKEFDIENYLPMKIVRKEAKERKEKEIPWTQFTEKKILRLVDKASDIISEKISEKVAKKLKEVES